MDASDGHEVLDVSGTHNAWEAEFTNDALLSASSMSDELRVYDLASGEQAWSRDISAIGERFDEDSPAQHSVSLSGRSVAVVGELGVIGFTDFPEATGTGGSTKWGDSVRARGRGRRYLVAARPGHELGVMPSQVVQPGDGGSLPDC